jgi:hypothetical protein
MENVTLRAHYDGSQILLDEPFELQPDTKLLVTVIQPSETEQEEWFQFSAQCLDAAYGDEPEYPLSLIKERNPDYEGG